MSRFFALIVLVALAAPAPLQADHVGVCSLPYCECTPAAHPSWTTINCTVPSDQKLDILEGDLPDSTTDLTVSGGEAIMFAANSLSRLEDIRYIRLADNKLVLLRKYAAFNLNVVAIYLDIENSDVLRIESRTFGNIKGPLSVTIKDCDYVSVEGETFSWLLTMKIANVRHLRLGPGSFMLDPTAANVGEHGPGMTIDLNNVTVPEFSGQTFGSSAARITMESVEVRAFRPGAFSANTYNVVMAVNCSFHLIEGESFAQKSLINNLYFDGCKIHQLATNALQSAIGYLNISHSNFEMIETAAINVTVAAVIILDSEFNTFKERGFVFSSWTKLQMERNSFDELPPHAIVAPSANMHELIFADNEIEKINDDSLGFIGRTQQNIYYITYKNNYFGQPCYCNMTPWFREALGFESTEPYLTESYCTVDEFFARCFNVPEQNMVLKKFLDGVCNEDITLKCEPFKTKTEGATTEIKNPRFPHKNKGEGVVSERDKKVIGIVIVTALGCVIIVLFISFIRWMRRKGYCVNVKNFLVSSNSSCRNCCERLCICGRNDGLDNAGSISQLSVNEYSERHRLNEPRVQEIVQETTLPDMYTDQIVPTEDKTTQTLPEELTKELLENLKENLEDPENYVEAREMIEHLYELIKIEESCNANMPTIVNIEENIYELPFQNTAPRLGKNKKQMISVGTRAPSIEKLLPLSPYYRQTALTHEYFEPKDFAVHLYAEIANYDKDLKLSPKAMPDLVGEQPVPRGPYLRAVREKINASNSSSPSIKSLISPTMSPLHRMSTINSTASNSSGKMMNRPLPEKPVTPDPGEGPSFTQD